MASVGPFSLHHRQRSVTWRLKPLSAICSSALPADPASLDVQIERGVLKLRIPKAEHLQPRRVEVKIA
jgi:hypothetical protein